MTYILTFTLAFCSVVYELLLGQTLSAFLGNTVLRYSVTIGLYMFSMGIGALIVKDKIKENPVVSLQIVELALAILGGFILCFLFFIDYIGFSTLLISFTAHSGIIIIGILTGLEIPLLMEIRNYEKAGSESGVLGVDYLGAFIGTIVFAFSFYPEIGLTQSSFFVAMLNAAAGFLLIIYAGRVNPARKKLFYLCTVLNLVLLAVLVFCFMKSEQINNYLLGLYLTN